MTPQASTRPRISREFIESHRRLRYVEATAEILHEFGRPGATTTNVIRLAGGARNSFYEVFRSIEDCISYGIGLAEAELFAGLEGLAEEDLWIERVGAAITGFYAAVSARPTIAELLLIHSAASRTDTGREAFRTAGARFTPLIAEGGDEAERRGLRRPAEGLAECLSWAIFSLAAARVLGSGAEALPDEAEAMAALVGGYYLGAAD